MDLMKIRYKQEMQITLRNIKYENKNNNNKVRRKTCRCLKKVRQVQVILNVRKTLINN